ncbi:antitoxin [Rathayibacter sp. VKM Ac-2759]|uniref:antitoxin n=1 Tax=Rathayibacter sp. VKM Ac-2759 TaxID=2609252 RepID=UPI0013180C58|nr:antitoxin [Rathayibacter sp. VKM Ac-2759]QHC65761.1 antitoxin [Rathayibacter sp. VKM Ac-2759]
MDLNDLAGTASELLGSEKAQEALHSEQAEQVSDDLLEKGADAAGSATGGRFDEQIDGAVSAVDGRIGTE